MLLHNIHEKSTLFLIGHMLAYSGITCYTLESAIMVFFTFKTHLYEDSRLHFRFSRRGNIPGYAGCVLFTAHHPSHSKEPQPKASTTARIHRCVYGLHVHVVLSCEFEFSKKKYIKINGNSTSRTSMIISIHDTGNGFSSPTPKSSQTRTFRPIWLKIPLTTRQQALVFSSKRYQTIEKKHLLGKNVTWF